MGHRIGYINFLLNITPDCDRAWLRPHIDGAIKLRYGEEIDMGSRDYELISL